MSLIGFNAAPSTDVYPKSSWQIQRAMLSGNRLHLQHGPINLVIKANGNSSSIKKAYGLASQRMEGMLQGLVDNLSTLREPLNPRVELNIDDVTSDHMISTARQFEDHFITPMAAVAGAVADKILSSMRNVKGLDSIYVNNGGDIALFIGHDKKMKIGIVPTLTAAEPLASIDITSGDKVRGIATSGWGGHSFSLGIADAVTVLAKNAAIADIVATLIANEVNCDSDCIDRVQALEIDPDSDLKEKLVTLKVGNLDENEISKALARGARFAQKLIDDKKIFGVFIYLQGHNCSLGWPYQNIGVKA